jgi:hypothetical protein
MAALPHVKGNPKNHEIEGSYYTRIIHDDTNAGGRVPALARSGWQRF